mgnify:CR=1 FL=1
MQLIKTLSTTFLIAVTTLLSCRKDNTTTKPEHEKLSATINIMSPYPNQVFKYGDTVKIVADVFAETKMHGCNAIILNQRGDTLFSANAHEHGSSIRLEKEWINNIVTTNTLTLKLICFMDHDGNTCEKTQTIQTQSEQK